MYWLYIVLVCAVSQYLGDMDTEGGPSVQEDETTPLLPLLYIPAPPRVRESVKRGIRNSGIR